MFNTASHRKLIFILIVIGYIFLMLGNGLVSLSHPDEVFYAQTAKEMIKHKSWMTPYIFDKPQFEKPALFYWLLIPLIKWFGASPFVARFPTAFFGILGMIVVYWISWMMFGSKRISFFAGFILGSNFIYIVLSRAVLTDMVFSIWVTISLGFFYYGYRYKEKKDIGIVLCFVFAALAVLTKGFLGICFPLAAMLGYLFWKKDMQLLNDRIFLIGIAVFAVMVVPWHVLMSKVHGLQFFHEYFYNIHLRRLADAEHLKCDTWYFYFGIILSGMLPWTFFLFPASHILFRHIKDKRVDREPLMFLVIWILSVYILVQLAHSKLASYLFPAFPAIAIIIAYYLGHAIEEKGNLLQKGLQASGYVLSGVLIVAAVLATIMGRKYIAFVVDMMPVYVFAGITGAGALAVFIFNWLKKFDPLVYVTPTIIVALLVTFLLGRSYAEPWVSCKQISDALMEVDQGFKQWDPESPEPEPAVLASKFYVRGIRFYTDRKMAVIDIIGKKFFSPHPIPFLVDDDEVIRFLRNHPAKTNIYGVVKESTFYDLKRIMEISEFDMTLLKEIGGKYLVRINKTSLWR